MIEMSNGGTVTITDSSSFAVGFYVDILQSGSSQVTVAGTSFTPNATRYDLLNVQNAQMQPVQKKQLKLLNKLFKLSLKAVKEVRAMPKTEGNIVQVTDKCGQKWLLAINFAQTYDNNVLGNEQQYVVVACKL